MRQNNCRCAFSIPKEGKRTSVPEISYANPQAPMASSESRSPRPSTFSLRCTGPELDTDSNGIRSKWNRAARIGASLHLVRGDPSVTVNGQALDPAEIANGYVNFKFLSDGQYFADGALPAQESEVPALSTALRLDKAVHISAVVNHAALETPKLLWVHFEATGSGSGLASDIAGGLATISNPQRNVTAVPVTVSEVPAPYQSLFSASGGTITQINGAVYEVVIPRPDEGNYHLGPVPASASLGVGVTFGAAPDWEHSGFEL